MMVKATYTIDIVHPNGSLNVKLFIVTGLLDGFNVIKKFKDNINNQFTYIEIQVTDWLIKTLLQ